MSALVGRRGLAVTMGVVSGLLFAACSSDAATIDAVKLQQNIQADASTTDLPLVRVDCPKDRPVRANDRFGCTAVLGTGGSLVYDVEIRSEAGDYSYKLAPDQTLEGAAVAAEITADITSSAPAMADAKVTCPKRILLPAGSAGFECAIVTVGQNAVLTVTKAPGQKADWTFKK